MPELDIIIPVYNEGQNIAATLRALGRHVRAKARVLICYDMPEDDTLPAVEKSRDEYSTLRIEFVKNPSRGAHAAVMAGLVASTAPYVLVYPADDDYNAGIVDAMVAQAKDGADVVCASRFMRGGSMEGASLLKNILVRVGNWVSYYLALVPTHDASNGFRLFSRRVITDVEIQSVIGFTYSIELLVKAHRRGWRIAEVPAQWHERRAGTSRFRLIHWLPAYLRWLGYGFATTYWHLHRALTLAVAGAALVALIVPLEAVVFVGSQWHGVTQTYADEILYEIHAQNIAFGNVLDGNPYYLEHAGGVPVVLFAGTYIASIPLWLHIPQAMAFYLDYVLWAGIFTVLLYWFLREVYVPRWAAGLGAWVAFVQSQHLIFRPSSRQEVYPVFALFLIGLVRLVQEPARRSNIILLGIATGLSFWVFSYLWQSAVIILGLTALWALVRREWPLLRGVLWSSFAGGIIGLPTLLYTLWLARTESVFGESIARFGLVLTHLPMAEVLYSGGWAAAVLLLLAALWWRCRAVFVAREVRVVTLSVAVVGLGLWIMQGSNAVTGILVENGEHLKPFIITWFALATVALAALLWRQRAALTATWRTVCLCALVLFGVANLYFVWQEQKGFLLNVQPAVWQHEQLYAAPLEWLSAHEPNPVVVWADPTASLYVPLLSHNYVLYAQPAMFALISDQEVRERYLIEYYFDPVSVESLKANLPDYVGRGDAFHKAKTVERGVKLCRLLFVWDKSHDCGAVPLPEDLLGQQYFDTLERQFTDSIRPDIASYLAKYHVSYILKDESVDTGWQPEALGATKVYDDGHMALYTL